MTWLPGPVVGVELTDRNARAVVTRGLTGARVATAEVAFDSDDPDACVTELRARLGAVASISIAVGYAHLHFSVVRVPPVRDAERVAILAMEPDRFFPVSAPVGVVFIGDALACAADADALARWVTAFERWGRVAAVVPAPVAAARVVREDGVYDLPEDLPDGEHALLEIRAARISSARRAPKGAVVEARPAVRGDARFVVAEGAAACIDTTPSRQLLSVALRRRFESMRRQRIGAAAVALALSVVFALWSFDHARERVVERLTTRAAQLADSAAPALLVQERLVTLSQQADVSGAHIGRPDPLGVLAALSERLPTDAVVVAIAADGEEWRVDGRTLNAARIVPALDGDRRFRDVHLAGPTTRFVEGTRSVESFSIAFHAVGER